MVLKFHLALNFMPMSIRALKTIPNAIQSSCNNNIEYRFYDACWRWCGVDAEQRYTDTQWWDFCIQKWKTENGKLKMEKWIILWKFEIPPKNKPTKPYYLWKQSVFLPYEGVSLRIIMSNLYFYLSYSVQWQWWGEQESFFVVNGWQNQIPLNLNTSRA